MDELARVVADYGGDAAWLEMLEREHAYVLARVRLWTEERRKAREDAPV